MVTIFPKDNENRDEISWHLILWGPVEGSGYGMTGTCLYAKSTGESNSS